jgi:uncharacterized protein
MHTIYVTVFSLLLIPGIFLVFIPGFPALLYMLIVAVIFGFVDHFINLTVFNLLVLSLLFVAAFVVDSLSGLVGARYGGASRKAMLWGIIGAIGGTFVLPPFGGLLGLFVGVLVAEVSSRKSHKDALTAAGSSVMGALAGMAINSGIALLFLVLFVFMALN